MSCILMYYLHLVQMFHMLFITDTTWLWDCGHRLWAGRSAAFRNSGSQSRASSGVHPPMRYGNKLKHFIQDHKDISRGLKNGEDLLLYFKTRFLSLQIPCTTTNLNGWLHNNGSDIWRDLYIAANLYRMYQSHTSKIPQTISIHSVVNMIILFIYFMEITG